MKHYILLFAVLFCTSIIYAQSQEVSLEKKGDLIEATYYHDNGTIAQKGTFKNGKLHGTWIMYNTVGEKLAVGTYDQGKKIGKWFFWSEDALKEVDYVDSKIVDVSEWRDKTRVAIRQKK